MTRDVLTVNPQTPYREIVDALARRQVTAAPVVDDEHRVIGVVSEADLLRKVEFIGDERQRRTFERPSQRAARDKAQAAVAADLMTAPAVTVAPETSVVAAARHMEGERVKRLPVVDVDGRLLGVVSRRDLLRMHLRPDAEIRDDIAADVLRRTLWIDPDTVQIDVVDGAVTIGGRVDRRSVAGLIVRLTADVPGVVSVTDRLAWDFDDSEAVRAKGYTLDTADRLMRPGGN
jgi:CBS-domain-containing membrane protein